MRRFDLSSWAADAATQHARELMVLQQSLAESVAWSRRRALAEVEASNAVWSEIVAYEEDVQHDATSAAV